MTVSVGQIIEGKYRIVRLIGQGGMGAVYEGINQLIDRRVAIKVMLPDIGTAAVGRFEQEARAAGRIGNDHILEILDVGRLPDGSHYMVAEYLDGESLESRLESRGALQPAALAPIALQLLAALGAAHRAGVLHRDLKPDNVFLVREKAGHRDFVKLIDFGISKFSQDAALNLTKTGTMVGTPYYMSPEQARGKGPVDARADLYAVGVILYQAVSGQLPFVADSFNDLLFKIVLEAAPPVTSYSPSLDPRFAAIITRAMAREAADRYQTAEALAEAIVEWLRDSGEAASMPALSHSYRQAPSRAAFSGSDAGALPGSVASAQARTQAQTPSPMATLAVDSTGAISGAALSQGKRGMTPPTPNTFGRTATEPVTIPGHQRPVWRNPVLWVAVTLAVAVLAFGAFLLAPTEDPARATSGPTSPAEAAHPTAAEPAAVPPPPVPVAPPPADPPPAQADAAAPGDAAPGDAAPGDAAPAASAKASTKARPTSSSTPKRAPQSTSSPAPAARPTAPAPASSEPANKRFYFGY